MTDEEKLLWSVLRNRKFHGLKFLRQHPIVYQIDDNKHPLYFIADFYCAEKKLAIEVDGRIHDFQKGYDNNRDEVLRHNGLHVLRLKNEECKSLGQVLKRIEQFI
ncbi:hypothetical protein PbJCM13498_29190 [Prolixibacter bellariivorans]|uniref:DUF559 domain-containing protein n=2 Tax=Prolixibacter bellariivorans TaxID=314319 RepID=A0A5M4B2D9_9BACT|nr:hypothetical protein PbJCM13498_29190 [Prolixibacter bellariivorans]